MMRRSPPCGRIATSKRDRKRTSPGGPGSHGYGSGRFPAGARTAGEWLRTKETGTGHRPEGRAPTDTGLVGFPQEPAPRANSYEQKRQEQDIARKAGLPRIRVWSVSRRSPPCGRMAPTSDLVVIARSLQADVAIPRHEIATVASLSRKDNHHCPRLCSRRYQSSDRQQQ